MRSHVLTFLTVTVLALFAKAAAGKVVFCYWGTWSHYRTGNGQFRVEDINPKLCTHIGYTFFGIQDDGAIRSLDTWLDIDLQNIAKTVALKQSNPNLKVLASVGGWNEGSTKYSNMAADAGKRQTFIKSTVAFLKQHGFDGLDLDWEYPAQRGGIPADKENYIRLLRELKAAFAEHKFLLTVAVAAGSESASTSYNIPELSKLVDLINVMTYDFAGSWSSQLGFNSPLNGPGPNTVSASVDFWLKAGANPSKIVLGVPLYGRTFTMASSTGNTAGSPSNGPGAAGPYTREAGYLGYNEFCESENQWTKNWDSTYNAPYAYRGNQWIGYDNQKSIGLKIQYIKDKNLAGAMVWSIETDDFHGICGSKFPLLSAVNANQFNTRENIAIVKIIPSDKVQKIVGKKSVTLSLKSNTKIDDKKNVKKYNSNSKSSSDSSSETCTKNGTFANTDKCTHFYTCNSGKRTDFQCPLGLHFDERILACNFPLLVTSCKKLSS